MTAFTARRRAEEFDSLVEGTSAGRSDARYDEFLAIVGALRDFPTPEPRPEFVTSLRERLMTAAATELLPVDDEAKLRLPTRKPARERRLAVAVGGLAIVGATTSMAVAAQSALPGDALYPLKRAIENAQTGFSADEADRGSHLLANASGRLDEVTELSREGDLEDNVVIASTLNAFTEQATEASDLLLADYANTGQESSIEELRDFTASSMAQLEDLEEAVPPGARDELIHAARVLAQIDAAAANACPTCAGGITEVPTILTSGSTLGGLGSGAGDTSQSGGKNAGDGTKQGEVVLPSTGGSELPPGSVLSPSTGGDTSNPSSGTPSQPKNPLGDLTDGLLGGGDSQTSNNPPQLPGVPLPDVEETLDELTDPLLGD